MEQPSSVPMFALLIPLLCSSALAGSPTDSAPASPAEDCAPDPAAALREALDIAVVAYGRLDADMFRQAEAAVARHQACLEVPAVGTDAARQQLVAALGAWLRRDEAALVQALDALVATDATLVLPESLAPAGSGLAQAHASALARAAAAPAPAPAPPPPEPVVAAASLLPVEALAPTRRGHSSWVLAGAGLASAALGGVALVVSEHARDDFWSAADESTAWDAFRLQRSAGVAGWSAVGVSASLVLGAAWVARW